MATEECALHAYVLMTNHFHLVITAGEADSIPRLMQSLGRRYVSHVNREYRRTGTLWEGRYKSTILDSESYVLVCHRYVESNAVRADLVSRPEDYPWSSYRHNALGTKDPLLRDHATYTALGATVAARRAAYRELFGPGLTDEQVETIRDATQRGWVPPAPAAFVNRSNAPSAAGSILPGGAARQRLPPTKRGRRGHSYGLPPECHSRSSLAILASYYVLEQLTTP
jgi:REP element-mobilizing transposase RayT